MHENAEIRKVRELIHGIEFAMLTTVDDDGSLISRPMATQRADFDGELWFFTLDDSPKAQHIHRERHVNVSYANPKHGTFLSLSGKADCIHDREKAEEMWNPAYKVWFPEGLDDPHLVLLRVSVQMAEYWEGPSNPVTRLLGFAKAFVTHDKSLGGGHRKLAVG